MEEQAKTSFTNLQLELLQLYSRQVSEEDLSNIKELIGNYFAKRLTVLADTAWDRNAWTQEDMEAMLNTSEQ